MEITIKKKQLIGFTNWLLSLLGSDWGGEGGNQTFQVPSYTQDSTGLTYFSYFEHLLLIKKTQTLNHLSKLPTLPLTMLFSASFTLLKYLYASWHPDFSRLPLRWWSISISQHERSAVFNNLMNTNASLQLVPWLGAFWCLSCNAALAALHRAPGTGCTPTRTSKWKTWRCCLYTNVFTNPHCGGRGFQSLSWTLMARNHKKPHFLHTAPGQRSASKNIK